MKYAIRILSEGLEYHENQVKFFQRKDNEILQVYHNEIVNEIKEAISILKKRNDS